MSDRIQLHECPASPCGCWRSLSRRRLASLYDRPFGHAGYRFPRRSSVPGRICLRAKPAPIDQTGRASQSLVTLMISLVLLTCPQLTLLRKPLRNSQGPSKRLSKQWTENTDSPLFKNSAAELLLAKRFGRQAHLHFVHTAAMQCDARECGVELVQIHGCQSQIDGPTLRKRGVCRFFELDMQAQVNSVANAAACSANRPVRDFRSLRPANRGDLNP